MLRTAVRAPARAAWGHCGSTTSTSCNNNAGMSLRLYCGRLTARHNSQASRPLRGAELNVTLGDGISHNVAYSGLWGAIKTFPKRQPFITNLVVATVKTSAADLIVQKASGKKWKDIDWKRNAVFTLFGFAYLGVCQWFIYVTLFAKLCPNAIRFSNLSWAQKLKDRAGQIDLLKQTAYDNFVHYTFIYFPIFYTFKELIQGDAVDTGIVKRAIGKYWNNCVMDNLAMWGLWIPCDLLIYAVPVWMRLPLNHGVSLAWTMILSYMRGA